MRRSPKNRLAWEPVVKNRVTSAVLGVVFASGGLFALFFVVNIPFNLTSLPSLPSFLPSFTELSSFLSFLGLPPEVAPAALAVVALAAVVLLLLLFLLRFRLSLAYIPGFSAILAFALGVTSSAHVLPERDALTHVYHAIQLFAGQGGWAESGEVRTVRDDDSLLNSYIHVARLFAVTATLSALLLLFRSIHEKLLTLLAFGRGHTILCGLGEVGFEFVRQWHAERTPGLFSRFFGHGASRLLILEHDPSNPHIESCRNMGYGVIIGDALDERVLHQKARAHRADTVVSLLQDDKNNIELTIRLRQLCQTRGRWRRPNTDRPTAPDPERPETRIIAHVDDTRLTRRAQHHNRLGPELNTQTRFFNFYEESVRHLLRDHPPEIYADALDAYEVHLAIYGFGQMGEALLAQIIRVCHFYREETTLRISIFDQRVAPHGDDDTLQRLFWQSHQSLRDLPLLEIHFYHLPDAEHGIDDEQLQAARDNAANPPSQHFVCFDSDENSASFALYLRDQLRNRHGPTDTYNASALGAWNAPVFVRLRQRQGLGKLFLPLEISTNGEHRSGRESPDSLFAFGMIEQIIKPGELIDQWRDDLARAFHEDGYLAQTKSPSNVWQKESAVNWPELDIFRKRSNRSQGDHVSTKLRAVRCLTDVPSHPLMPSPIRCLSPAALYAVRADPIRAAVGNDGTCLVIKRHNREWWAIKAHRHWREPQCYKLRGGQFEFHPISIDAEDARLDNGAPTIERHGMVSLTQEQLRVSARHLEKRKHAWVVIEPNMDRLRRDQPIDYPLPGDGPPPKEHALTATLSGDGNQVIAPFRDGAASDETALAYRSNLKQDWTKLCKPFDRSQDASLVDTAFSSCGQVLAVATEQGSVAYAMTRDSVSHFEWHYIEPPETLRTPVTALSVTSGPDEAPPSVALACGNSEIWLWDTAQWTTIASPVTSLEKEQQVVLHDPVYDLAFSPDCNTVVAITTMGVMRFITLSRVRAADGDPRIRENVVADPWIRTLLQPVTEDRARDRGTTYYNAIKVCDTACERLARVEHNRWNAYHLEAGWRYGETRLDAAKIHDNIKSWDQLDWGTQTFDRSHITRLQGFIHDVATNSDNPGWQKVALCRDYWIGLVGQLQREHQNRKNIERVKRDLFEQLARDGLPRKVTIVTTLDEQQKGITAKLLEELNARLIILLPLPFELYYMTFATNNGSSGERWEAIDRFTSLVARADVHIELPMRFGDLYALAQGNQPKRGDPGTPRRKHYRLVNAYIAQRCDRLLVGSEIENMAIEGGIGEGSVREAIEWWQEKQAIPKEFQWHNRYHQPPIKPHDRKFIRMEECSESRRDGEETN